MVRVMVSVGRTAKLRVRAAPERLGKITSHRIGSRSIVGDNSRDPSASTHANQITADAARGRVGHSPDRFGMR
jgi:hypothetical protein